VVATTTAHLIIHPHPSMPFLKRKIDFLISNFREVRVGLLGTFSKVDFSLFDTTLLALWKLEALKIGEIYN
jgi:hypothetical protein